MIHTIHQTYLLVLCNSGLFFNSAYFVMVVPPGFEPGSPGPKPEMMDHYTTGLRPLLDVPTLVFDGTSIRQYQAT